VIAHAQLSRGPFDSLRELLVFTESIHDSLPVDLLVKLHLARGIAETKLGQAKMAKAYLNKAIHTADGAQVSLLAKANLHLGALCGRRGEHKVALANLNQAVEIAKKNGLLQLQCRILAAKGVLFETTGKLEEALKLLGEAQLLASKHHFRWEEIHTRTRLGALYSVLQDKQEEALYHLNWSLDQSGLLKDRKLYEPFLAAGASASLGRLLLNQGKLGEAAQHFKRAKQIYRTMSDRLGEGRVCMGIALLQLESGGTSAASTALKEAEELFYSPDTTTNQVYLHCIAILAALVRGEVIEAQDYFLRTQAMDLASTNRSVSGMMACIFTLVQVASGEMAQAIEFRNHARASLGWFHRRGQTKWGEGAAMLAVAEAAIVGADGQQAKPADENARGYVLARISWRALNVIRGTNNEFAKEANRGKTTHEADLLIGHNGRWFQRPPEPVVDLSRKRTLGPLLCLLARKHATIPDQPMSVDEIFQSVWTGENVLSKSRKNRVYVAMNTLRKLGLDEFIVTRGAGYLLHPKTKVLRVPENQDKS
jgi:tetratricopeptide (TPR) repeat protein